VGVMRVTATAQSDDLPKPLEFAISEEYFVGPRNGGIDCDPSSRVRVRENLGAQAVGFPSFRKDRERMGHPQFEKAWGTRRGSAFENYPWANFVQLFLNFLSVMFHLFLNITTIRPGVRPAHRSNLVPRRLDVLSLGDQQGGPYHQYPSVVRTCTKSRDAG
jgi:hypothetical protein